MKARVFHPRAWRTVAPKALGAPILAVTVAACGTGDPYDGAAAPYGPGGSSAPGSSSGATAAGGGGSSGLPCDIQALMDGVCGSCHGNPPAGGAPMPLATYADWTARKANGMTYGAIALARMQDTTAPMPPRPAAPATQVQIDAVRAFINAGYPSTGCGDGGSAVPATIVSACTNGKYWPSGYTDQEGLMQPGRACIACHQSQTGEPKLDFGGTVYPTVREPDLCYGVNGSSVMGTVIVTDANGTMFSAPINANGNFFVKAGSGAMPPFSAKVVSGGRTTAMAGHVPTGDCNSCHTEQGAMGAPGRITLP